MKKKLLCAISACLCLSMSAPTLVYANETKPFMMDFEEEQDVTLDDTLAILKDALGIEVLSNDDKIRLKLYNEQSVETDMEDVLFILRRALGIENNIEYDVAEIVSEAICNLENVRKTGAIMYGKFVNLLSEEQKDTILANLNSQSKIIEYNFYTKEQLINEGKYIEKETSSFMDFYRLENTTMLYINSISQKGEYIEVESAYLNGPLSGAGYINLFRFKNGKWQFMGKKIHYLV